MGVPVVGKSFAQQAVSPPRPMPPVERDPAGLNTAGPLRVSQLGAANPLPPSRRRRPTFEYGGIEYGGLPEYSLSQHFSC